MTDQKSEVLARIRAALGNGSHASPAPTPAYRRRDDSPPEQRVERFIQRAADYRSDVRRIAPGGEAEAIGEALRRRGVRRLVVPADLPAGWIPDGIEVLRDEGGALSYAQLDSADGVLTGCALAIAQTGTIVLDAGPTQGRRVLTLLPDYHLCVVDATKIVGLLPEGVAALDRPAGDRRPPVTFISGPSATVDIEFSRVAGVHGPRTLDILVVG